MSAPPRIALDEARAGTPRPGERSVRLLSHGTLDLRWYAPRGHDAQTPHDRDEVYVVVSGSGWFRRGEARVPFGPGDALFVAAGIEHRFEEFTEDFGTWVMFYGPPGGEAPDQRVG
ncbi:MAG: cupin domain-containing protein [Acidisphaera sp.]|nr:cupin domain-containing protein [Acidisphaera sp.]